MMVRRACPWDSFGVALQIAAVCALSVTASVAHAQTVDEILQRHAEAVGGAARWQNIRTLRMSGRATAGPGREALVTREIKRPGRVRTEFTFQGTTGVFAVDGKRGWQISPLTGIVEPRLMDPDETLAAVAQSEPESALVAARKQGATLALVGRETVSGRETLHVRVTARNGSVQDHFVDAETFLTLRTTTTRRVGGRPVDVETTFSDYRSIGGLVLPHRIEMGSPNRPDRMQIVIEAIELNVPIDDGRFKAPSGTRR
jgi:outer membrane lipoprotein-sorting protein